MLGQVSLRTGEHVVLDLAIQPRCYLGCQWRPKMDGPESRGGKWVWSINMWGPQT